MVVDQELEQPGQRLKNYGPTIFGAIVVLAIIGGGIWFWQTRTREQPKQVAQQKTPTPAPTLAPTPTSPQAKIDQLPATGFPTLVLGAASLAALAVGIALKKFYK